METRCELHSQRIISDLEPRQWDLQPGMLQGLGLRSSRTPLRGWGKRGRESWSDPSAQPGNPHPKGFGCLGMPRLGL